MKIPPSFSSSPLPEEREQAARDADQARRDAEKIVCPGSWARRFTFPDR